LNKITKKYEGDIFLPRLTTLVPVVMKPLSVEVKKEHGMHTVDPGFEQNPLAQL